MRKLCVVLPALNEELSIESVIRAVPRDMCETDVTVIVVDDGSDDNTSAIAKAAGAVVVRHAVNRGVGAAFRSGVEKALELGADYMVNIDADGQFDPADIPKLLEPLINGEAEFVSASRFIKAEFYPEMSKTKFYGNKLMSLLISVLTGKRYYDVSCGFRAYSREVLLSLNLFGDFTYTQETFLDLSMKRVSIKEVPLRIVCGQRKHGTSRVASSVVRYGLNTAKIIFRAFRDYQPLIVFGAIGTALCGISAVGFGFLGARFILTGTFSPYKWIGYASSMLGGIGFLILITGLVADMLLRIRMNQERMLYLLKKAHHRNELQSGAK